MVYVELHSILGEKDDEIDVNKYTVTKMDETIYPSQSRKSVKMDNFVMIVSEVTRIHIRTIYKRKGEGNRFDIINLMKIIIETT